MFFDAQRYHREKFLKRQSHFLPAPGPQQEFTSRVDFNNAAGRKQEV
jgi:hypothetical protein